MNSLISMKKGLPLPNNEKNPLFGINYDFFVEIQSITTIATATTMTKT
jgi:hypothetical protein